MNPIYVNPIASSSKKKTYPSPTLHTKELLQKELDKRNLNIQLKHLLKGGWVSQVYEAIMDGKPVVVKHTEDLIPFDPTELFIGKKGHNVDSHVLKLLQHSQHVRVPKVYLHLPDITMTVMENMRQSGFRLMIDNILNKSFSVSSAKSVGKTLAYLAQEARRWKSFKTNLSAEQNSYERGLELRLAYPNTQKEYLALEKEFTGNNRFFTWLDGHPKNIFVDPKGDVAFIDFGNSAFADQRYMLPNLLAHIVLYSLSGYITAPDAGSYISSCIDAYRRIEPIDEKLFCQYLAMEVFHRANGKWVAGIETRNQKLACLDFAFSVFDENINAIEKLLSLLL